MSLLGKRILITRTRTQASELAAALTALGAEPILIPTIQLAPPTSYDALDTALAAIETFDWLLFTSSNAVEVFAQRQADRPISKRLGIAAIGPATARGLEAAGLKPDLIPPQAVAESFAEALLPHAEAGERMLLIRAEQARDHLPDTLIAAGADLTIAPAYRTVIPEESVSGLQALFTTQPPDAITFTSSSTATNFFMLLEAAGLTLPTGIALASIGPITSQTLRDLGHPPTVEAAAATTQALTEALQAHCAANS